MATYTSESMAGSGSLNLEAFTAGQMVEITFTSKTTQKGGYFTVTATGSIGSFNGGQSSSIASTTGSFVEFSSPFINAFPNIVSGSGLINEEHHFSIPLSGVPNNLGSNNFIWRPNNNIGIGALRYQMSGQYDVKIS